MKHRFSTFFKQGFVVALAFLTLSGAGYVFAQPTEAPGGSAGVPLPLHTGTDPQTKQGNLTVTGTLAASGDLTVGGQLTASEICLNGTCETSWPSGGGTILAGSQANVSPFVQTAQGGGSYSNCEQFTIYYSNGQVWSGGVGGHCGNRSPISVQFTAPGTVISTSNVELRCVWAYGGYSYYDVNFVFGDYGYSEPYYTPALNVATTINGSTVTVSGECPVHYGHSWIRPSARLNYMYQQ